jgi:hypothetical protein
MPPPTFIGMASEWNDLTDLLFAGSVAFATEVSNTSPDPFITTRATVDGQPSATIVWDRERWSYTLYATPSSVRPWASYTLREGTSKNGIAAASQTVSAGLSVASGNFAVEYALSHPTFKAKATVTPDAHGLPTTGFLTCAACETVDAGVWYKYDPLRSGLIDYDLGARMDLGKKWKNAIATVYVSSANKLSLTLFGRQAQTVKGMPLEYGLKASDNAARVCAAARLVSPCGRKMSAILDVRPRVDLTLGLVTRINDTWRVDLSLKPLQFLNKPSGAAIGATFTAC